jgi:putative xylitol transport system permease protein
VTFVPDRDDNTQGSWFGSGRSRLIVQEYGIFLAFLLLVVILTFSNQYFLTPGNISNVLLQTSINGVLAIGMTFVILTRGIDLSVGSVVALAGIVSASFVTTSATAGISGAPYPMILALGVGILVGVGGGRIIGGQIDKDQGVGIAHAKLLSCFGPANGPGGP